MDGIRRSIEPAMTQVGNAELNPATGILTLKDTKEAVEAADEIVQQQIAIYSRMVHLKFQTVDFTITDNGEAGVDWNAALTKALEHIPGFTFTALSPASLVSANAGSFGLGITSGGWNGTQAIVNALKQYGTVSTSVTIPMSMRNRHGAQYNNRRQSPMFRPPRLRHRPLGEQAARLALPRQRRRWGSSSRCFPMRPRVTTST